MISDISEKIKLLCDEKKISINQLAKDIGMSSSLHTTLKKNSLSVETLMKISEVLGVPITAFFEDENETTDRSALNIEIEKLKNTVKEYKKECEHLILSRDLYLEKTEFLKEKLTNEISLKNIYSNSMDELFTKISIHEALPFINKDMLSAKFPEVVKNLSINQVYESEIVDRFYNLLGLSSINEILNFIDLQKFENSPALAKLLSKYEVPDIKLNRKKIIKQIKETQSAMSKEIDL